MLRKIALATTLVLGLCTLAGTAEAQYKNTQFGFEGGYVLMGKDLQLDQHGFGIGLRGAYKGEDHWWFSARALLGFRGEETLQQRTVVLLHLVPVDVRYYFETDSFRPFVGITNAFNFMFNQSIEQTVYWGPGVMAGLEFRLRRDLFLGFQADAYYMFVFEGPDDPIVSVTTQLNFFL